MSTPAQTIRDVYRLGRMTQPELALAVAVSKAKFQSWLAHAAADDAGQPYSQAARIAAPSEDDARMVVRVVLDDMMAGAKAVAAVYRSVA